MRAAEGIVAETRTPEFRPYTPSPPFLLACWCLTNLLHPNFLVLVDFGVCAGVGGRLYATPDRVAGLPKPLRFSVACPRVACAPLPRPSRVTGTLSAFSGLERRNLPLSSPRGHCRQIVTRKNVILLEIEPEVQKTRIDFACTETLLGVRPVCVTKVRQRGRQIVLRARRAGGPDRADL